MSTVDESGSTWFREYINPNWLQMLAVRETLFSGKTAYQEVAVFDTPAFGRCLFLDGKTQSAEVDEFIYHEALVQPAMVTHPRPESVFIAGGGEGATLREVLSHSTVKRATMVDIDSEVVEICRRFLPNHHKGAFDDPRVELHFQDAKQFLETTTDTYDVMIVDLPDPQEGGPAAMLYTRGFYSTVLQRLNPGGMMVVQSEPCMAGNLEAFSAINHTLGSVFPQVFPYHTIVSSFSSDWGFNLASTGPDPVAMSREEIDRRLAERGCNSLRFYDGEAHQGLFVLPKFVRQAVSAETRVITEDAPLVVF